MVITKTQVTTASESHVGTCPVCRQRIAIVNYTVERGREMGYLGRHTRPGIPFTSKCRGSFGRWVERVTG
jgi:hypothetical protein